LTGSETWNRLQAIYNEAIELPEAEREAYVREACGDDEELLRRALKLVAAHGGGIDLGGVVAGVATEMLEEEANAMATRRFGPYRIVREIGSGGMGTVFLGERADDEFEKQVAIKIVRGGLVGAAGRARFETERQILASLEHPGIARLLDGGTTDDGVPFVVMEFVDGQPVTEYAREQQLDTRARLRLFLDVCAAIQYAHNALVIHLDIKPGNILVPSDGQPRLLDFGIARLLEDDEARMLTRLSQPLTPEYASPEQVQGRKLGTGTDVYALGVLLYELLSGSRPFDLEGESAATIEKVITSREPVPPSRVPEARRRIHPDLDSIVLMALNKDVARRYPSVAHMADDIRAHLSGQPVTARPSSALYRAGKFVGRNRLAVAALAAIAVITVGFGFRLAAERDAARIEAARAQAVTEFVTGLFEYADPERSKRGSITAREILDSGLVRLRTELTDQPEVRSSLYSVVGYIYSTLSLDTEAEPVLREALAVALDTHGSDSLEATSVRAVLDGVLWRLGQTEEAMAMAESVVDFHRAEASDDPSQFLEALQGLGVIRRNSGDSEQAIEVAEEMLRIAESLDEGPVRDTAFSDALDIRGLAYGDLGRYEEAIADLSRGLAIELAKPDFDATTMLQTKNNLATAYVSSGNLEEGGRLLRDIAETEAQVLGPQHRDVGITLHNLSTVLKQQGDYAEAERMQRKALDIHLVTSGEQSPIVASAYNNLANLREDQGDPEAAIELHQKALSLSVENFGEDSAQASLSYYNIGRAYRSAGDLVNAERYQRRALDVDRVALGPEHPVIVQDLRSLGQTLQQMNRLDEGDGFVEESLQLAERVLPKDNPELARSRSEFARVELRKGRAPEAAALFGEALRALRTTLDEDHWEIGLNENLLGSALWEDGDWESAAELLKTGYAKLVAGRGATHPLSVDALARLEQAGLEP